MVKCVVSSCMNRKHVAEKRFFSLPQDPAIIKVWLAALREPGGAQVWTEDHVICEDHFLPEDVSEDGVSADAIPIMPPHLELNAWPEDHGWTEDLEEDQGWTEDLGWTEDQDLEDEDQDQEEEVKMEEDQPQEEEKTEKEEKTEDKEDTEAAEERREEEEEEEKMETNREEEEEEEEEERSGAAQTLTETTAPPADEPTLASEREPAAPPVDLTTAPTEQEPAAPPVDLTTAPTEREPAAPPVDLTTAPTEREPAAPPVDLTTAPTEREPAAPPVDLTTAPTEREPAAPTEHEPTAAPEQEPTAPPADDSTAPPADDSTAPPADASHSCGADLQAPPTSPPSSWEQRKSLRDDVSLHLLTRRFLELLMDSGGVLDVGEAAKTLCFPKRRVYDITSILMGAELLQKAAVGKVRWTGKCPLSSVLGQRQKLQQEQDKLKQVEDTLDGLIKSCAQQLFSMTDDINNANSAFVTFSDVENLAVFQDQTVMVVKAPEETKLEVPAPTEDRIQVHLKSGSGPISVLTFDLWPDPLDKTFRPIQTIQTNRIQTRTIPSDSQSAVTIL